MSKKTGCKPGEKKINGQCVTQKDNEWPSIWKKNGLLMKLKKWEDELWRMRTLEQRKLVTKHKKQTFKEQQDPIRYAIDCLQDAQGEIQERYK